MRGRRIRDLGISIGLLPPGSLNSITDVAGVRVGHSTIVHDAPRVARTGVTVIVPDAVAAWQGALFAGYHCFNGCGEMTGLLWVHESGTLTSPIALTNTHQAGLVRDALAHYAAEEHGLQGFTLPVVAETYDGWLSDMNAQHVTERHVYNAMAEARGGAVEEGCVGGGTGTICHEFKGGIGTASRIIECCGSAYTVGALVQANYGTREQLRVNGIRVGLAIGPDHVPMPWNTPPKLGSIIVVLATDAPLLAGQCRRLAQRATAGLARTGGIGHNSSGDIFLAFSTANVLPANPGKPLCAQFLPNETIGMLFEAAAEATEESILNALVAAETTVGLMGRTAYALPLDRIAELMKPNV